MLEPLSVTPLSRGKRAPDAPTKGTLMLALTLIIGSLLPAHLTIPIIVVTLAAIGVVIEPGWWTVKQCAEYAQVGTGVVYRECAANRLKCVRVGGRRDIRIKGPESVDAWLAGGWRGDGEPAEPRDDAPRTTRAFPRDAASQKVG